MLNTSKFRWVAIMYIFDLSNLTQTGQVENFLMENKPGRWALTIGVRKASKTCGVF